MTRKEKALLVLQPVAGTTVKESWKDKKKCLDHNRQNVTQRKCRKFVQPNVDATVHHPTTLVGNVREMALTLPVDAREQST